jgi:hypothetical protein
MKAFLITLLALFFLTASLAEALESALSIDLGFAFPLGKMAAPTVPPNMAGIKSALSSLMCSSPWG